MSQRLAREGKKSHQRRKKGSCIEHPNLQPAGVNITQRVDDNTLQSCQSSVRFQGITSHAQLLRFKEDFRHRLQHEGYWGGENRHDPWISHAFANAVKEAETKFNEGADQTKQVKSQQVL